MCRGHNLPPREGGGLWESLLEALVVWVPLVWSYFPACPWVHCSRAEVKPAHKLGPSSRLMRCIFSSLCRQVTPFVCTQSEAITMYLHRARCQLWFLSPFYGHCLPPNPSFFAAVNNTITCLEGPASLVHLNPAFICRCVSTRYTLSRRGRFVVLGCKLSVFKSWSCMPGAENQ